MGAQKILFMDLLRIITPEEISELTTKHEGEIRFTLTQVLEAKLKGAEFDMQTGEACGPDNVLPFPHSPNAEVVEEKEVVPQKDEPKVDAENEATSSFILAQKKRFEKNQKTLKAKEILQLYSKEASVNIDSCRRQSNDLRKSTEVGLLIDKKHY